MLFPPSSRLPMELGGVPKPRSSKDVSASPWKGAAPEGALELMLRLLAGVSLLLTGADHVTTWLCLRSPVLGWEVSEANPLAGWLFDATGLVYGLAIDSVITLAAVVFLITTASLSHSLRISFLAVISLTTGFAVVNNVQAIHAMGLWPMGMG